MASQWRKAAFLLLIILCLRVTAAAQNAAAPIRLSVDLTDAARRIFHAHLTLPTKPGRLTLLYPKWIPGEHAPDGPVVDVVDLRFTANGRPLSWRRDDLDMYTFYID